MIDLLERCKDRPALFNEMILNRPPYWSRQKDLCRSVVKYRTTVAYTGNIDSLGYERLVCIGNPIRAEGKFVDLIRQADRDRADQVPPRLAVNAIRIPSTESPHAHLEKSPCGLADKTWIDSTRRKHGERSLYVGAHIDARIPDASAAHLIEPAWLDHHRAAQRPAVPRNHYINTTRRISCDLSEGVGRDTPASWSWTTGACSRSC
jgi:hypothetical protein